MAKIVLVGGGSSSGKTYITTKALKSIDHPEDFVLLSFDDYYKDISFMSLEERKKQNFDSPDSFDWPLLMSQIQDLKEGKTIQKPVYDFNLFTRSKKTEETKPAKVLYLRRNPCSPTGIHPQHGRSEDFHLRFPRKKISQAFNQRSHRT